MKFTRIRLGSHMQARSVVTQPYGLLPLTRVDCIAPSRTALIQPAQFPGCLITDGSASP